MPQEPPSTLLLTNGRFCRDAFDDDPASALLVQGGEIAWIGDRRDAPSAARTIDLGGALVLPGLTDAHIHVFSLAMARHQLDLAAHRPATIPAVLEILQQENRRLAGDEWLQASGINEAVLGEQRLPTRQELDEAFGPKPVLLRRYCGHMAVFNTAAMRMLGIAEDAPDPEFGHFERLADGRLNGTAVERAAEAIFRAAPAPAPHLLRQGIRDAVDDCLRFGLTALTEAAVGFSIGHDREDEIWNVVRAEGDLPLRMGFMAQLTALEAAERQLTPVFDRRWSRETLKFFADGIVGGRTSALSEPFCDRGGTGTFMLPESVLTDEILAAHAAGWRVAVHATGDRAIERVASAYEQAEAGEGAKLRHRIEHCFCPPPGLFERLRRIDALVVMQPSFLWRMGPSIAAGLGPRTETAYPGRSVLAAGARLVLSSDAPTGLLSPWDGIRSAVERASSDGTILGEGEAIGVREAVDAAIAGGAAAMRHEGFRGRLLPGLAADLAVLDRDPFSLSGAELAATRATLTMVDGKIVHHDA